jgi:hypothetical protein
MPDNEGLEEPLADSTTDLGVAITVPEIFICNWLLPKGVGEKLAPEADVETFELEFGSGVHFVPSS